MPWLETTKEARGVMDVCRGPCVEPGLPWVVGLVGLAALLFLFLYYLEMGRRRLDTFLNRWRDWRG